MSYASRPDLVERVSLNGLAQVAAKDSRAVDGQALAVALADGDLSGYDSEVRAEIAAAVKRIDRALEDAQAEIDGYIGGLDAPPAAETLRVYAVDIAVYRLYGGGEDSDEHQRYRTALAWLQRVSDGRGPAGGAAPGRIVVRAPDHGASQCG